jgi:hypothetical protein
LEFQVMIAMIVHQTLIQTSINKIKQILKYESK